MVGTARRESWLARPVRPETICLALLSMLDLLVTVLLISAGVAEEANPLMAFFLRFGLGSFCLAKLLLVAVPLLTAEWYRRYNERLVVSTLRFVLAAYVLVYIVGVLYCNRPLS